MRPGDSSTTSAKALSDYYETLLAIGSRRRWAAGATLFREGEPADCVVLVDSGRVKVTSLAANGKQTILAIRNPGDLLGEFAAFDGLNRSATVTAITAVTAVTVSGQAFRAFLNSNGPAAFTLLHVLVSRLRESDMQRLEFGAYVVHERLARLLLDLTSRYGNPSAGHAGTVISLPLSQAELAEATGASREAVAKSLRKLRELGAIHTARRRIEVLRPDVLHTIADVGVPSVYSDAEGSAGGR